MATVVEATPAIPIEQPQQRRRSIPPALIIGGTLTLFLVVIAVFAPEIAPNNPLTQNIVARLQGPSAHHLLGTDQLGRDTLSRLIYGARTDLKVGFLAVLFPFIIGTFLGSVAGYFGGWVDSLIMRLVDVVLAFPFFVLVIALVFVLGAGEKSIYIAITAVGWVAYCRIIRGQILVAKQQDYVLAAQAGGLSHARIIARHLLPNVITQAIVYAMSDIVQDILAIVTLSYLGLGIAPPTPDWGSMISQGQDFLTTQWELSTFPGLAVVFVGLSLSLFGDGLADLLRGGER
jgi:peptide/nickel transport system permease protein